MVFSIITELCNDYHNLSLEYSHHPKGNPIHISSHSSSSSPCTAVGNSNILTVSRDLPMLDNISGIFYISGIIQYVIFCE